MKDQWRTSIGKVCSYLDVLRMIEVIIVLPPSMVAASGQVQADCEFTH